MREMRGCVSGYVCVCVSVRSPLLHVCVIVMNLFLLPSLGYILLL